jgi:hypothetical protein
VVRKVCASRAAVWSGFPIRLWLIAFRFCEKDAGTSSQPVSNRSFKSAILSTAVSLVLRVSRSDFHADLREFVMR